VVRTRVGYTGGSKSHPTYHDLGSHSESVEVLFDPGVMAYDALLEVFWAAHDPTAEAWSSQYRSAVFFHGSGQQAEAEASKRRLERRLGEEVATAILPAGRFWVAEDYHQKWYLRRRGGEWLARLEALYPTPASLRDSTAAARLNGWLGGFGAPASPEQVQELLLVGPAEGREMAAELGWKEPSAR
jgi:peptide-methionine (S)-S-oxide reductase